MSKASAAYPEALSWAIAQALLKLTQTSHRTLRETAKSTSRATTQWPRVRTTYSHSLHATHMQRAPHLTL
eukprot:5572365-Prymnesium_polylepis.1